MSSGCSVVKSSVFLQHEEGTKYYEVVTLWNHDSEQGVLVKRWGKQSSAFSIGGELKVQPFADERKLSADAHEVINAKLKRGYKNADSPHGLHLSINLIYGASRVIDQVVSHYGSEESYDIYKHLGTEKFIFGVGETDDVDDVVCEEPPPEPVRDASWGSW